MSEFSEIRSRVRSLINDNERSGSDVFIYSTSDVFSLSENNISDISTIYLNDSADPLDSGDYEFDSDTEKVSVSISGIVTGDILEMNYTYTKYSDSELNGYIKSALIHLSANNFYTFTEASEVLYPTPSKRKLDLIAMITSVLIQGTTSQIRLPDLVLNFNEKLSVSDKIKKIIACFKKDNGGIFFHA